MNGGNSRKGTERRIQDVDEATLVNADQNITDEESNPDNCNNFYAVLLSPERVDGNAWNSEKEKKYADDVKVGTVHGNIICQNIDLEEVKEHYIYKVLISHNVTEIAAIYKTSKEKF